MVFFTHVLGASSYYEQLLVARGIKLFPKSMNFSFVLLNQKFFKIKKREKFVGSEASANCLRKVYNIRRGCLQERLNWTYLV
jgi:hypothetical protein